MKTLLFSCFIMMAIGVSGSNGGISKIVKPISQKTKELLKSIFSAKKDKNEKRK